RIEFPCHSSPSRTASPRRIGLVGILTADRDRLQLVVRTLLLLISAVDPREIAQARIDRIRLADITARLGVAAVEHVTADSIRGVCTKSPRLSGSRLP